MFSLHGHGRIGRWLAKLFLPVLLLRAWKDKYSAVQVRDRAFAGAIASLIARGAGVPFFYWMSFPFAEAWAEMAETDGPKGPGGLKKATLGVRARLTALVLYRFVLPRARHIFVQSDAMREMLTRKGVPEERMTVVPMGVVVPEDLADVLPCDDVDLVGRRVVVYLGALERMRRPDLLIGAIKRVSVAFPDVLLVLVGDSQNAGDREWLEGEVERHRAKNCVKITGWLDHAVAVRYLRRAEVGVSPFPRTPVLEVASPTKVCEYLAYGLPCVANDQPDQAALLRDTGGGICAPLTEEAFATAITQLLADPVCASRMGQEGRQRIARLRDYRVIAESLAATYARVLGQQSKA